MTWLVATPRGLALATWLEELADGRYRSSDRVHEQAALRDAAAAVRRDCSGPGCNVCRGWTPINAKEAEANGGRLVSQDEIVKQPLIVCRTCTRLLWPPLSAVE